MLSTISSRALQSLSGRASLSTIIVCAAITASLLIMWVAGVITAIMTTNFGIGIFGEWAVDIILGFGSVAVAWMLFPILLPVIANMFLDRFLQTIAREEYQTELHEVPLMVELPKTLLFLLQALLINLVCVPFYFVPVLGQLLYFSVNGYLLAREFWVMVADRLQLKQKSLKDRRKNLWMIGLLLVLCANTPLLNLLAPLLAGGALLHLGFYALEHDMVERKSLASTQSVTV